MGNCLYCGKEVPKKKGCYGMYCNNACQGAEKTKKVVDDFLNNQCPETFYNEGGQIRRSIRLHLIKESGNKCSICGWSEVNAYTNTIPLEVDHSNGDWRNCSIENLRVICPNCHSLTETYRGRNKGNGREYRRKVK